MFGLFHIREHQRGLWFRKGDFQDVLQPGSDLAAESATTTSRSSTRSRRASSTRCSTCWSTKPALRAQLAIVDLARHGARDRLEGRPPAADPRPGPSRVLEDAARKLDVEIYSIAQTFRFAHPQLQAILQAPDATKWFDGVQVDRPRGRSALPRRRADRPSRPGSARVLEGHGQGHVEERSTAASRWPTSPVRKS